MMLRIAHDATVGLLQRVLGRSSISATVTASNLANVDTPGYRSREVSFTKAFEDSVALPLATTHPTHVETPDPPLADARITEDATAPTRADGNSVDIDEEMTRLAAEQGRYAAAARMVRARFALLRYAAMDGKG